MADVNAMTPLERQFHQACLDESELLKKEYGYNPTYFLQMVHQYGAVEAVHRLLKATNYQDGLYRLWELRQLHCSIEAGVLRPKWSSLFTEAEKAEARKRLKSLHYDPLTDKYDVKS